MSSEGFEKLSRNQHHPTNALCFKATKHIESGNNITECLHFSEVICSYIKCHHIYAKVYMDIERYFLLIYDETITKSRETLI